MNLEIIVMGHPVKVRAKPGAALQMAMTAALEKNKSDPSRDWEFCCDGRLLDPRRSAAEEGLHDGQQLTLFPRAGFAA